MDVPVITQAAVRIHVDHGSVKRLGSWTTARRFEVRVRRGAVVIDLRSREIGEGDIDCDLRLDHATLTLLVSPDAVVDTWDLAWTGRGRVKQTFHPAPASPGRVVRIHGTVRHGEVRVHSGGTARLLALFSREFLADARRARAEGRTPTLDDPAGDA